VRPYYREQVTGELRKNKDVQTGIRFTLLDMLYDGKITIPEFRAYCIENGLDYNNVEHCCGCAGCYEKQECSPYPDDENDETNYQCQIRDSVFCNICGQKGKIGYPLTDDNNKEIMVFWACDKHADDKKLERELKKGTPIEKIFKKWNK
jgi:hypothetical protein